MARADTTDVIVVGGGGSGLSAAATAAERGARVVVVEKNPELGGTTRLAVGSFSAAGTRLQRAAGVTDTPSEFVADMAASNGELEGHENVELRDTLAANAGAAFDWVSGLGVQFFGPTPEPPFRNPRMHNVIPSSRAYVDVLSRYVRSLGVDIRLGCAATSLTMVEGHVSGIEGANAIAARRAVILAAGDYSASPDLKREWISERSSRLPAINPTSTGDGLRLGRQVGAAMRNPGFALHELRFYLPPGTDVLRALPSHPLLARAMRVAVQRLPPPALAWFARRALTAWVAPSKALFEAGAILVDADGERFANELGQPAEHLGDRPHNRAFVIFDATLAERFSGWPNPISTFPGIAYAYLRDYERYRPDAIRHAGSIASLASAIGARSETLVATVAGYNGEVLDGTPDPFGREAHGGGVRRPPFYALGPLGAFVTLTDGGLAVDTQCRVLDAHGRPIFRLYAAGSNGQGGLILKNHGLHIGWAITSGRIAGAAAAAEAVTAAPRPPDARAQTAGPWVP